VKLRALVNCWPLTTRYAKPSPTTPGGLNGHSQTKMFTQYKTQQINEEERRRKRKWMWYEMQKTSVSE
jgi:hypothetical protein